MTHGSGKSDSRVGPKKPPNEVGQPAEEVVEGRRLTKGNPRQTRPACTPVDASAPPSRDSPHDSGPAWIAIPSPYDSFNHFTMPV